MYINKKLEFKIPSEKGEKLVYLLRFLLNFEFDSVKMAILPKKFPVWPSQLLGVKVTFKAAFVKETNKLNVLRHAS